MAESPTVLVVDDMAWVRGVLSASLRGHGFEVLLAENAKQALDLCQQTDTVRVALVDRRLPDMDGLKLLNSLWQLHHEIRGCLMSGDADHSGEEDLPGLGRVRVFPKPFQLEEVAQALRQLLDEVGPPDQPAR